MYSTNTEEAVSKCISIIEDEKPFDKSMIILLQAASGKALIIEMVQMAQQLYATLPTDSPAQKDFKAVAKSRLETAEAKAKRHFEAILEGVIRNNAEKVMVKKAFYADLEEIITK